MCLPSWGKYVSNNARLLSQTHTCVFSITVQEQMKWFYLILLFIINPQDLNFPTPFLEVTVCKGINF